MTLWIWETRPTSEDQAVIYGCPEVIQRHSLHFGKGVPLAGRRWPLVELPMRKKEHGVLPDAASARGTTGEVFGPRLRELLASIGVTNLEYFPLRIRDEKTKRDIDDYRIANILGVRDCIDSTQSKVRRSAVTGNIMAIDRLALDESKAGGLRLFRLSGCLPLVLATEDLKLAVEKAGTTGVRFFAQERYKL